LSSENCDGSKSPVEELTTAQTDASQAVSAAQDECNNGKQGACAGVTTFNRCLATFASSLHVDNTALVVELVTAALSAAELPTIVATPAAVIGLVTVAIDARNTLRSAHDAYVQCASQLKGSS
jgi:hypothetical protein